MKLTSRYLSQWSPSVRRGGSVLCLAALGALAGCGEKPGPADTGVKTTADAGKQTTQQTPVKQALGGAYGEAISALGEGAAAVVLVHPGEWSSVGLFVTAFAGDALPTPVSFTSVLRLASEALLPLPATMPGLDEGRPLGVALGEPLLDGPPGQATGLGLEGAVPGVRHQIRVPVKSPDQLMTAWSAHLDHLGPSQPHNGGKAWALPEGQWITLIAEKSHVRGVLITHATQTKGKPPAGLKAPEPSAGPLTPALKHFSELKAPMSALVRSWQLAPLTAELGMANAQMAIQSAPDALKGKLMTAAQSLVAFSEAIMVDGGATFDDHVFELKADAGGVSVQVNSSFTTQGAKAFTAAMAAGRAAALKGQPEYFTDVHVGASIGALLKATPEAMPWRAMQDQDAFSESLFGCGLGCNAYALLRAPLPVLKTLDRLDADTHAVLPYIDGVRLLADEGQSWASMWSLSDNANVAGVKAGLKSLYGAKADDITLGGKPALVLSESDALKGALAATPEAEKAFLSVKVIPVPKMGGFIPIGDMMKHVDFVSVKSVPSDRVLSTRVSLQIKGAKAPESTALTAQVPAHPSIHRSEGADNACLNKAMLKTALALGKMRDVDAGSPLESQVLTQTAQKVAADLKCARQSASTASGVKGLEALYGDWFTRWATLTWETGQGQAWLNELCEGQGPACEARDALAKSLEVKHIEAEYMCHADQRAPKAHGEPRPVLARLAWIKGKVHLDGKPTTSAALEAALKAKQMEGPSRIDVAVEGDAKFSDITPLLMAARAAGADEVHAVIANVEGDIERVPMAVGLEKLPRASGFLVRMDAEGYGVRGIGKKRRVKVPTGATLAEMRPVVRPKADDEGSVFVYAAPGTPWGWVVTAASSLCPKVALVDDAGDSGGGAVVARRVPRRPSNDTELVDDPPSSSNAVGNSRKAQASFRSYVPRIKACYERALKGAGPDFSGRLVLEIEVGENGKVKSAKANGMKPLHKCVLGVARRARFAPGSGPITLKMPFIFTPQ
ncbi:MAG: AgmX/PglI C-terminal domain-containing protein [Bradymonadia bacterium]